MTRCFIRMIPETLWTDKKRSLEGKPSVTASITAAAVVFGGPDPSLKSTCCLGGKIASIGPTLWGAKLQGEDNKQIFERPCTSHLNFFQIDSFFSIYNCYIL